MPSKKKAVVNAKSCVACGCCVKACPLAAISVYKGLRAVVNSNICVGCGRCALACPAGIIEITANGGENA